MSYTRYMQFVQNSKPVEVAVRLLEFEREAIRWRGLSDYHRTKCKLLQAEIFELEEEAAAHKRQMEQIQHILAGIAPEENNP